MKLVLQAVALFLICSLPAGAQTQYQGRTQHPYANWQSQVGSTVNRTPLVNQQGFGYYNGYAGVPCYPGYQNQAAAGLKIGSFSAGAYWKSPSGYYYPFYPGACGLGFVPPVVVYQQGAQTPTQPPVSDMFKDMNTFLSEQNSKGKYSAEDYNHLNRRLKDLIQKHSSMVIAGGGTIDPLDEENLRKDLAMLSGDIARRAKP